MTAEQMEELLRRAESHDAGWYDAGWYDAQSELILLAPSLARRVLAAEKLVAELEKLPLGDGPLARIVTAYREASK